MTPITSILPASEWFPLGRCLRDFAARAEELCYVANMGNAGDALIASGAWQLFDAIGLRPRVVSAAWVSEGASVIYAGGGNLTPDYPHCALFLRRCMAVGVKEAMVLPHTIRGHGKLLQQLDERFMLVCRDLPSLEWCTTTARAARTMFSHDLALRLDVRSLQRRCTRASALHGLDDAHRQSWAFSRVSAVAAIHAKPATGQWYAPSLPRRCRSCRAPPRRSTSRYPGCVCL